MPLDVPQESQSDIAWIINGKYSDRSATTFQLTIVTEGGSAAEAEGDAFHQQLVDVLAARFPGVVGTKSFTVLTTRTMLPS
ncbi:hypothetical protein [Streptomyces sp. NPDC058108]|uniref:hypothetical protein n=1 Tax=Streptomyces sp. NPDC058108 TaxID=3346344 RepID=UPI0036F0E2D7